MVISTILGNVVLGLMGVLFLLIALSAMRASLEVQLDDGILNTHENEGLFGCLAFVGGVVMLSIAVGSGIFLLPIF